MKIEKIQIRGIKSHKNTTFSVEDYNTIVGENNSGKSNILFAIRWFFKHGKVKISKEDITRGYSGDPSVTIEFKFDEDEDIPNAFETSYGDDDTGRKFIVEAFCKYEDVVEKPQAPKYQFRKVWKQEREIRTFPKIVDIIFVPSIRELNDEFKFTQNSTINKLVSKYVIRRIMENDVEKQEFNNVKDSIKSLSECISVGDDSAFEVLKGSLNNHMLDYENVEINFSLEPPDVAKLIKNSFKPSVKIYGDDRSLESQGMGFQRSLIFSLICNLAEIERQSSNLLTLYLIEEPELFLHPNHQDHFKNKLVEVSGQNNQVILTSHSPYFLNNIKNYSQLKRISLISDISNLKEIKHDKVLDICNENGALMAEALNHDGRWNNAKLGRKAREIADEDELRYLLWIDPDRANAFLSKKVILVEGSTEKALFSFIFDNPSGDFYNNQKKYEIMVVDTNGKYHFYKFANLLKELGIKTWILHDGDGDRVRRGIDHRKLNNYISKLKDDKIIVDFKRVDPDLEGFLGIQKDDIKPDISLYQKIVVNDSNCRTIPNYMGIIDFVNNIINH